MRILSVIVLTFCFTIFATAQLAGNPENWCREGFFTRDSKTFEVATVKASRAYFYGDQRDACPGGSNCRTKAFVVSGDEVVVGRSRGGFACAWYPSPKGQPTVGWIKTSDLTFAPILFDASAKAWLGDWSYGSNSIGFTEDGPGALKVKGSATWVGANPGNVHVGELDGLVVPKNGEISYSDGDDEYDCKATMRLLGSYLIVADNLKCGGLNVTFSGVYTTKRR